MVPDVRMSEVSSGFQDLQRHQQLLQHHQQVTPLHASVLQLGRRCAAITQKLDKRCHSVLMYAGRLQPPVSNLARQLQCGLLILTS